jgi:adenylate cyclase
MVASLRVKFMSGVVALMALFALALSVTLFFVRDSGNEVAGIVEYHLPFVARINALDVYTYEIELVAHALVDERSPTPEYITGRKARAVELTGLIDKLFAEAIDLAERGSNDRRNDLVDRLELAKMVGSVRALELDTRKFTAAVMRAVNLAAANKIPEARQALNTLGEYEGLDPVFESLRKASNAIVASSLRETEGNIFSIISMNVGLFGSAAIIGAVVFLVLTGRLQHTFRSLTAAFHQTAEGHFSDPLPVTSADEIGQLTGSFNQMVTQLKSKERLRDAFGQFLDPRIVASIVDPTSGEFRQSAERRRVTIFFSDICGFSALGEQLTADTLVRLLNEYFSAATEGIRRHRGIVDKFIGDSVMAFWASPFSEGETHARDACLASLELRAAFAKIKDDISDITGLRRNVPNFGVRMALATGDSVIGTIGSRTTKSFTVIGDSVNIASRLEGINRIYGTTLLINEACYQMAGHDVEAREVDLVTVYGKSEPVRIFELLCKAGEIDATTARWRDLFTSALGRYRDRDWAQAEREFRSCLEIRPDDGSSRVFLNRIATFAHTPPPSDWNGVWQATSK